MPLAWTVETAREVEQTFAAPLLAQLHTRGFRPVTAAMDSAYDVAHVHDAFEAGGCRPVVKLRKTQGVLRGDHKPPTCEHGTWTFAGADYKRGASKWALPHGRVQARLPMGQGEPPAPTDPARDCALGEALCRTLGGRA